MVAARNAESVSRTAKRSIVNRPHASVRRVNDGESLLVEMEGHGRESISESLDLSRTVGWFTSLYPVRLDISDAKDPLAALKLIKEQAGVPRGGLASAC